MVCVGGDIATKKCVWWYQKNECKNSLKAVVNECVSSNKTAKIVPAISQTAVDSVYVYLNVMVSLIISEMCHGGNTASKFECKQPNGCRN